MTQDAIDDIVKLHITRAERLLERAGSVNKAGHVHNIEQAERCLASALRCVKSKRPYSNLSLDFKDMMKWNTKLAAALYLLAEGL